MKVPLLRSAGETISAVERMGQSVVHGHVHHVNKAQALFQELLKMLLTLDVGGVLKLLLYIIMSVDVRLTQRQGMIGQMKMTLWAHLLLSSLRVLSPSNKSLRNMPGVVLQVRVLMLASDTCLKPSGSWLLKLHRTGE